MIELIRRVLFFLLLLLLLCGISSHRVVVIVSSLFCVCFVSLSSRNHRRPFCETKRLKGFFLLPDALLRYEPLLLFEFIFLGSSVCESFDSRTALARARAKFKCRFFLLMSLKLWHRRQVTKKNGFRSYSSTTSSR